eukprot:gb/GEZN01006255.1/.p1 GENE.gb/GEZN01006255.1/~~gb/GEZN01006255.1/.p1  ORF type:complete len:487 (+),score=54.45 gb/GEZN01006255.1/:121-1581(+)
MAEYLSAIQEESVTWDQLRDGKQTIGKPLVSLLHRGVASLVSTVVVGCYFCLPTKGPKRDIRGVWVLTLIQLLVLMPAQLHYTGLLWISLLLSLFGTTVSVLFSRHVLRQVFNLKLSEINLVQQFWMVYALFWLTYPLEIVWRVLTAPWRVLPTVLILGEARCGTTSLASQLYVLPGFLPPFCGFFAPPLSNKESFYFVGHYFGLVYPSTYRMCFPTKLEVWLREWVLGQKVVVYDACAQFLTAPWVARQLHRAVSPPAATQNQQDRALPQVKLVACVREPVQANLSWWQFEQNQVRRVFSPLLGDLCSLPSCRQNYPLTSSFASAFALSLSSELRALYQTAGQPDNLPPDRYFLPDPRWYTFPNGQLSVLAQMGNYLVNLQRYEALFGKQNILVMDLEEQEENIATDRLDHFLNITREHRARGRQWAEREKIHPPLNQNMFHGASRLASPAELKQLALYYRPLNSCFFHWLGRDLGWHRRSYYMN